MNINLRTPKVFISYSWDNENHKHKVKELALSLRADGVDVTLDIWHALPGSQLPNFIESAIKNNDYVIIICTPKYKMKSDNRLGGVGYEGDIITGEVYVEKNHNKFIPVIFDNTWQEVAPVWLLGKIYLNLNNNNFEEGYKDLINTLFGVRDIAPPLGNPPEAIAQKIMNSGNLSEEGRNNSVIVSVEEVIEFVKNNIFKLSLDGAYSEYNSQPQRSDHRIIEKVDRVSFSLDGDFIIAIEMEYIAKTIKKNYFLWHDAEIEFHFETHEIYFGNFKDISSIEVIESNNRFDKIDSCVALRFTCYNGRDLVEATKSNIQYTVINGNPDQKSGKKHNEKIKIPYFEILFMKNNPYGTRLRNSFNHLLKHFGAKKDVF